MSPMPARLATTLAVALALGAVASPASALFGKSKPKAEAKAEALAKAAAAEPAEAVQVRKATAEQRAAAERMDALSRATFWAREAQVDPADVEAPIKLSKALRALGRNDEAAQAAGAAVVMAPGNVEAMLEVARARIAGGQAFYAVEMLEKAKAAAPRDWRPLSLLGVALEQTERVDEARQAFDQALVLSPENPAVLSNLAMLHATRGQNPQAEALLRRAVARPGATSQERVNLALVLGLQGKMAEAERLMRQELPPEIANANLAYLRADAGPGGAASARSWGALEGAQIVGTR